MIFVVYRQPDDSRNGHKSDSTEFKEMLDAIENAIKKIPGKPPNIFICGDFNLPHVKWENDYILRSAPCEERKMFELMKEIKIQYFLNQIVKKPTHKDGNTLDLIFTD